MPSPNQVSGSESVSCSYYNNTDETRLVRLANASRWYFEGRVDPYKKLSFLAPANACIEVYVGEEFQGRPVERIACSCL